MHVLRLYGFKFFFVVYMHIHLLQAPQLYYDNVFAIYLSVNPVFYARAKHIEVDYYFLHEQVVCMDLTISYVPSADQIADIFTKGLSHYHLSYLISKLTVVPPCDNLHGSNSTRMYREVNNLLCNQL